MTQWPRGLVDYVPSRDRDATPDPEEDRTAGRLALAGRLIAVLRSRGIALEPEVAELRAVAAAWAVGDRRDVPARLDRLLAALDRRVADVGSQPL